jgi:catechol 2,3-dioxygenase-like lactoylglutathione lyase family enzyme
MKMKINGVQHVSMRVADFDRAFRFYIDVLGLVPHPEKSNWLGYEQGCPIHLMLRTRSGEDTDDPSRHVALRVERLEDVVDRLLGHGCTPFQSDVRQSEHRPIHSADQPLDFGIGTIFVRDPDGNLIEFVQKDRGIFGDHDPSPF